MVMLSKKLSKKERATLNAVEQHGINRGIAFAKMLIVSALLEEAGSLFASGLDERARLVREMASWVSNREVKMKEKP